MINRPSDSTEQLAFGEETLVLIRRWGYDTRIVALELIDQDRPLVEIGQAVGRDSMDVLHFACRCAPKLRALAPDAGRAKVAPKETRP